MIAKHFKKQEVSIKKQMSDRKKLLTKFVKLCGKPVIVHAVHHKNVFHKILNDGKLDLPRNHKSPQKTPYMEKFLGIDNCLYYSLGFVYYSSYKWKYNLIFDIKLLKDLTYYNNSVNFQVARAVVNYWYDNDKEYLEKLADTNEITRATINRYYTEEYNGKVRTILEFWKIEKELFEYINNYKNKKELLKLIHSIEKKHLLKYPASEKDSFECYLQEKAPEMVGKKPNNLLKNPYFLGFFIPGNIDSETKSILSKKYSDKILFDGKSIKKIKDI